MGYSPTFTPLAETWLKQTGTGEAKKANRVTTLRRARGYSATKYRGRAAHMRRQFSPSDNANRVRSISPPR